METKEYRLTDICDFQGGTQPPKEEWINEPREGYVRMLQIRDFTQGKAKHIEYVKDNSKINKCDEGDILIGRYGASVGKILTGLAGAYNVAIVKTIPNEEILSKRYLYFVLTGTAFQNFIAAIGSRAAQAGFNKDDLSKYKLHLPSLKHQNQIAEVLEKAQNIIPERKKSINLLDEFLRNTFFKMFGDPIQNQKGWDIKTIESLVKKQKYSLKRGPFGGALKKDIFVSRGYLVYEQYHALNNDFTFERYYIDEEKFQELKAFEVFPGDIIISCSGVYLGKLAIVPQNAKRGIINQALLKITLDKKVIDSNYFVFLFSHNSFKNKFYGNSIGSGVPNFPSMDEFKKFQFIYPPLELQNQFSKIVETTEAIKKQYQQSLQKLENLYNSLSQKAFTGELDIISSTYLEATLKIEPKITAEIHVINKINKEIETFHNNLPHSGASNEVDNKLRQLETELKFRGEVIFDEDYLKYKIVKTKFKNGAFTFQQLWQEITKFPFDETPKYDHISTLLFDWLYEDDPFIKQIFNTETKQIELQLNETTKA